MFHEPPRRRNPRLAGRNYSDAGVYFVTICVDGKHELLSSIHDSNVSLTEIGSIVDREWRHIPNAFPQTTIDEYVVMPNHLHGILVIGGTTDRKITLGNIIRQFKARVTNALRNELNEHELGLWQGRYHDHIIRGSDDLDRIRHYIRQNPASWEKDEYYPRKRLSE
jgi:REP element-mobilizing transposase RayT